jgi:hypothetical protein
LSSDSVDSPHLVRRLLRSAGVAPAQGAISDEDDDDATDANDANHDDDDDAAWSDEDPKTKKEHKAAHKAARKAERVAATAEAAKSKQQSTAAANAPAAANANSNASSTIVHPQQQQQQQHVVSNGTDLLQWRLWQQVQFVRATAHLADLVTAEFQHSLIDLGIAEACVNVLLAPAATPDEFHSVLCALGLLQRLPKSATPHSMPLLVRLCELSRDLDPNHVSIRALSIALLAAVEDKKLLDNLGVFSDCLQFARSDDARTSSPLVRHALAIALANFSLDQARQVDVVTAIGMARLVQWAKSLDAELKMCAAAIVANGVANPALTQTVVYEGGLTILVKLFAAPGAPIFKEHAARGLANLAGHVEAQVPMIDRGVLALLARVVLESPVSSFDILRSALRCLSYLSASDGTRAAVGEYVARSPQFGERVGSIANGDNAELAKHAKKVVDELAVTAGHPAKKTALTALGKKLATRRPSLDDLDAWHLAKKNPDAAPTTSQLKQDITSSSTLSASGKQVVKRRVKKGAAE